MFEMKHKHEKHDAHKMNDEMQSHGMDHSMHDEHAGHDMPDMQNGSCAAMPTILVTSRCSAVAFGEACY